MRRRAVLCLSLTLAALAAPTTGLAAGAASFSVRPGHYNASDPASRAYFKRTVAPGASFSDTVVVGNGGSTRITLLVNAVDGLTGQTSGSVYANRGVPRRKAGAWVVPAVSRVSLDPGAQTTVAFTVHVPAGAVPGDHLAGIAFQNAAVSQSTGSFQVRTILREVVGVLVRVPGPARPDLRLGRLSLQTLPGTKLGSVVVALANRGRLLCKPRLAVTLASPARRERIRRQLDTVLPGDAIAYPLVLEHDLARATYAVHATAACPGTTATSSRSIRLGTALVGSVSPRAETQTVVQVQRSGSPVWLVAGISLAAGASGTGIGWALRRRRKPV